jgi:hypothetical protein
MAEEKKIKDIMSPIEQYDKVNSKEPFCQAIGILRRNHEKIASGEPGAYHKTLLVTDGPKGIIGKLTIFDLIKGLVPETVKTPSSSRAYYRTLSSRVLEVEEEVGEFQKRFKWLHNTFCDLVTEECGKTVGEVMSPVYPLLTEDDTIDKAIYIMFKEHIRQPMVVRNREIVCVISIMDVLPILLDVAASKGFGE